jgi:hypothetical protein
MESYNLFCSGWLPISASQVARITSVSHQHPARNIVYTNLFFLLLDRNVYFFSSLWINIYSDCRFRMTDLLWNVL